jgi:hypothetical protein
VGKFRWNEVLRPASLWDTSSDDECTVAVSDGDVVRNPGQLKFEDVLRSLCGVVSELMDIEEKRGPSVDWDKVWSELREWDEKIYPARTSLASEFKKKVEELVEKHSVTPRRG